MDSAKPLVTVGFLPADGSKTHKLELERRQQIGFGNFIGKLSLTNMIFQFVMTHWGLTLAAKILVAHWILEDGIATRPENSIFLCLLIKINDGFKFLVPII